MWCNLVSCLKVFCGEVDMKYRDFLWGDDQQNRRLHLINWDQICRPKIDGALGLRKMQNVDDVLMLKAAWNLCAQPNVLWVATIRGKYNCRGDGFPIVDVAKARSNFWRGICGIWNKCWDLLHWGLCNK